MATSADAAAMVRFRRMCRGTRRFCGEAAEFELLDVFEGGAEVIRNKPKRTPGLEG